MASRMSYESWIKIPKRGVIALEGKDANDFLQGIITNDISQVSPSHSIYGALLTPQGSFLHDFLIVQHDGTLLLDCDADSLPDLVRLLGMYRLRADVSIDDQRDRWQVLALLPASGAPGAARNWRGGVAFTDPRHAGLGDRALLPVETGWEDLPGQRQGTPDEYTVLRIGLGVPDGAEDLVHGRTKPLEGGLDDLNGVSFDKGCFVGQEVTARMKHRDLVRKRMVPVAFEGPPPPPGTPISNGQSVVGEIRSGTRDLAMAMLRLDQMDSERLQAGDLRIRPAPAN